MKWDAKDQIAMFDSLESSVDSKTKEQPKLKFLDLFAGIGGFRLGMEQAGHECVGFVEWDKYARKSYEAIHNTEGEWTAHDITGVTDDDLRLLGGKGIDVICGGFPCQAFSAAGKRGGFADTRGTLFFEIARIAEQIKPRILLLENVKGLLSHEEGRTFGTILNTLDELGYDCEWQVLNSKNFGVPQNRERVFIVGHLRGSGGREVFPFGGKNESTPTELSSGQGVAYCIDANYSKGTSPGDVGKGRRTQVLVGVGHHPFSKKQEFKGYHNDVSPCLIATDYKAPKTVLLRYENDESLRIKEATKKGYAEATPGDSVNYAVPRSKTRRGRVGKGIANTLDTGCQQGVVTEELRIRKLTPRECWRLQGFPDWAFDKAQQVNSDSQLYKQAGNSVTVNVIHEIAKRLN